MSGALLQREYTVCGLDVAWDFRADGIPNKASLLHCAFPDGSVYLFRLLLCGVPPNLKTFLCEPTGIFVGRQIGGDVAKLQRDFQLCIPRAHVVELGALAASRGVVPTGQAGLATICEAVLG
ncbi:MAG: hypothetical protein ACK55I_33560, partial [bacterium]